MESRINIQTVDPEAYKAMYALEKYLSTSQLPKNIKELIKIRASQINGCAFCIDMHTTDAVKAGESNQRIFLLNAWRETSLFSEEEKLVLAITEEITLVHQHGLSKDLYEKSIQLFGELFTAQLIMMIVTINAWNRIAISTQRTVEPRA
ncbi:MAG: carboxymuconolactone decarboxylase family protein [Chitinophagaceae bacterium]|nr:MAG: carboxymuconolactone decarboxylase family protein [Chitinophagaceae bacterium]